MKLSNIHFICWQAIVREHLVEEEFDQEVDHLQNFLSDPRSPENIMFYGLKIAVQRVAGSPASLVPPPAFLRLFVYIMTVYVLLFILHD